MELKRICCVLVILLVFALAPVGAKVPVSGIQQGIITVIPVGNIKIHSYLSPEKSGYVSSQIIETPNKLVIVDTQYQRPYAKEVREYAESLGKPIERVIISHEHPDHWFGNEYFRDTPIYALPEVNDFIQKQGDSKIKNMQKRVGDLAPAVKVEPTNLITGDSEIIDNVKIDFIKLKGTEAPNMLLLSLPDYHVLIAQDVVYHHIHPYLGLNDIEHWITTLQELQAAKYEFVFTGHGLPGSGQVLKDMIDYLLYAQVELRESNDIIVLKQKIMEQYPGYKGAFFLDISAPGLFTGK